MPNITLRNIALTFAGGVLGTWLRVIFGESFNTLDVLILVNAFGSAALGFFNAHSSFQTEARKSFWAIGFCGGFTTMSAAALWLYSVQGFNSVAVVMIALMFAAGIAAYAGGLKLGRKW